MRRIYIDDFSTPYFITEDGKCFNGNSGKYLVGHVDDEGYLSFTLTYDGGRRKRVYAHALVAANFLDKPTKRQRAVGHKDGDRLNNCADNLEWGLSDEEVPQPHVFCFTPERVCVAEYVSLASAAAAVSLSTLTLGVQVRKEVKTLCGGFFWSDSAVLGPIKQYAAEGLSKRVNQYSRGGKYIMTYPSTGRAAAALGLSDSSSIGACCRGAIKTYKNFVWRYADDIVSPSENQESLETPSERR